MALTKPKLSTNINTDSSVFSDPILVLHQGAGAADIDVGFLMNRSNGLTSNAAVIWQESSKSFVHILTNSSGVADSNLVVQSYANVSVGNVLLINNSGIYVDGTLGTAGQVLASDGFKTYWAPPGGFTGGTVAGDTVFQSNLVVSNTTNSTSSTTGALVILGGAGVAGNVYSNALYVTSDIFWAGNNAQFTANAANWLTIVESADDNVTYNIPYIGDVNSGTASNSPRRLYSDATGLTFNPGTNTLSVSIVSASSVTATGIITTSSNTQATSTTTGALRATGGLSINTGNVYIGGSAGRSITAAGNIVVTGAASTNTTTGALVVVGGAGISGALYTGGIIDAAGNIVADSGTASTNTTTGALIVNGGAGVSGNVYSNAVYTATGVYWSGNGQAFTSTTIANTAEITANLSSGQNVGLSLTATGVTAGNYGSATSIPTIVVDNKGRITSVTSNAVSTTITLAGGSGSGSVAGGGTLTVNGTTDQITTAVSGSTITIALAQNITTPGNLTVAGNLIVQGNTTTLNTETLTVEDLNITVAGNAGSAAAADGAGLTVAGANARLLYKSETDSWVFDRGVFASGNLVANSGTTSTSITTGALVVDGGMGISNDIRVGGAIVPGTDNTGFIGNTTHTWANGQFTNLTVDSTLSVRGAVDLADNDILRLGSSDDWEFFHDGTGNYIDLNVGDLLIRDNTTQRASFSRTTGNLVLDSTTTSTSGTTGALVVKGGAGITGNVYTDALYTTTGLYWASNGAAFSSGAGATLGFPNSTISTFPTGDYGDFTDSRDAFGVHISTVYDLMEPNGSIVTVELN